MPPLVKCSTLNCGQTIEWKLTRSTLPSTCSFNSFAPISRRPRRSSCACSCPFISSLLPLAWSRQYLNILKMACFVLPNRPTSQTARPGSALISIQLYSRTVNPATKTTLMTDWREHAHFVLDRNKKRIIRSGSYIFVQSYYIILLTRQ